MKPLDQITVSLFANVHSRRPETKTFLEVMNLCLSDTYRAEIGHIRRYAAAGKPQAAAAVKAGLPAFSPSGEFAGGHAAKDLVAHSGIVCVDYDHIPDDRLATLAALAAGDPHTVAALRSPTDGLKVFAHVEGATAASHASAYALVAAHYDRLLGLAHDRACKDVSRLCYLTHDPGGYTATLYTSFELEAEHDRAGDGDPAVGGEARQATAASQPGPGGSVESYIFRHPLIPGQRNANLYRIACEAARDGWDEGALRGQLWSVLQGTDFTFQEMESAIHNGYKEVTSNTIDEERRHIEKDKRTKRTKRTFDLLENDNDGEEAYWEGEELRKRTPLFPESVYENLPELLEDAIPDGASPRQRDVALLAQLVSVGAALPHTWGRYNRRNYSPHLYAFVIAPAGSGKSVAETGRLLLKSLHERVELKSKIELHAYEKSLREWKERTAARGRKAKAADGDATMEQPESPPYRSLLIPANTSAARLYLQIRDNGDMGGVIFDTEAQTLANANGMDYGHFDDILRKCFEHERLDYSYKAAGMEPIVVPRPKLALLLTGTAQQYAPLLQNSENGLASRVLFYTWREEPRWVDVGEDGSSYEEQYLPLADRLERLHDFCAAHPANVHLTPGQWRELNRVFAHKLAEVPLGRNDNLQAVVKRYACVAMRLAMTLTRLRQAEAAGTAAETDCRDDDFRRALDITLCCYEHARLVMSAIVTDMSGSLKDPDEITYFLEALPERFTTSLAQEVGRAYGFCERKVTRTIKSMNGLTIRKLKHGEYEKLKFGKP